MMGIKKKACGDGLEIVYWYDDEENLECLQISDDYAEVSIVDLYGNLVEGEGSATILLQKEDIEDLLKELGCK